MKRIVYIIPDSVYGGAYPYLKAKFYDKYDISYSALEISGAYNSELISTARDIHSKILQYVQANPGQNATLYLDQLQEQLKICMTLGCH